MNRNNYKVYKHTTPSGKCYIGITCRELDSRWKDGKGYEYNTHFKRAITKYGWDNITHEVLFQNLTKEQACQFEMILIKQFKSNIRQYGYNLCTGGEGRLGDTQTVDTRNKISNTVTKHWQDPQYRQRLIEAHKGRTFDEETRQKISKSNKLYRQLNPVSDEMKQRISQANTGKTAWNKGKTGFKHTDDTKRKISNSLKGRHISDEQKKQISARHKGKVLSEETKEKIRQSLLKRKEKFNG